jgi:hypothetical protein
MRKNNEFRDCTLLHRGRRVKKNFVISFTYGQIRDPQNNEIWASGTTNLNTAEGGNNNGIGHSPHTQA